jgi:CheY-like chemotaxis protein/signal transduction histidine kinase
MTMASILLVEDNPITRRLVRSTLETNDFVVREAEDGRTALELLAIEPSDLVLQALNLPDVDGFALAARLRMLPGVADVPILAVSGFLSKHDEARVSAGGFNDVITKPVEASRLLQIVRAHLPNSGTPEAAFGGGRRLLVVDDDTVQRKLLSFHLNRLGFETAVAADGIEALELARRAPPDAIVADVMMPRLDGFGLCVAIRKDAGLSRVPLVLVTNSYIEDPDRELAAAAGANQFVVRSPEMREVVEAVRASLVSVATDQIPSSNSGKVEEAWARRVVSQLDRQVALNAGIAQRCTILSAEISILSGISDALAKRQDTEAALVDVLAACLDAGGISLGGLFLYSDDKPRLHKLGSWEAWSDDEIGTLFRELDALIVTDRAIRIPEDERASHASRLLAGGGIATAILVPLLRGRDRVGTLLMGSRTDALQHEDHIAFTQGVATQISQALTLTQAFAEKEASEKRFEEQAAVLRSILESVAEGVVVTNATGKVLVWNSAAEAILPRKAKDVPLDAWAEQYGLFLSDTMRPVPNDALPLVRALRGDAVDGAELFVRSDSAPLGSYINMSTRPLRDEGGALRGGVAVFRDVTVEKTTQAQLMVTDRMASVGVLAAGVAHEINNPLAAVLGNLDIAIDQLTTRAKVDDPAFIEGLLEALQEARDGADKVRHIVRDLKLFSRAEEDKKAPVNVVRVLDSALRLAWNEVRHRARVRRAYGNVPLVDANESRLGQVFLNLLVNAAQAIPEGRADENEIAVTTRVDALGRVVVDVADSGAGMHPDVMKRLFTPFFTTKPVGFGTGLGLSICHRLVSAVGGEITVESVLGKGTTFHVALPASSAVEIPSAPASASPRHADAPRRGRVLVVDDDVSILNVVTRVVGPDHECHAMRSGSEALGRIRQGERFDVILCDLMMPVMTGMDLFNQLVSIDRDQAARVVFLTGGAFTSQARAFLREISNPRLDKPFELSALKNIVNSRLRKS